ncbi:MAG: LysR family transcriptional regulator [Proteobacteria bacterium]|nr:MAG: LysR family transcriptional regulator [Pseudomonadota bacterium]
MCGVTQPTLSMQIQKLEEDLGVVIFDRSKKPVLPTAAGAKLIAQIQTVLFETKKLEEIVTADQEDSLHGDLVLGVIPTIAPYVLPKLLPIIEKNYPDMKLRILELQTHRIVELAKLKRVKYASLKFDDIWLLEEGHCLRHQVLDVCSFKSKKDDERRFKFESGSLETLKSLVASYGGYTLLPALATGDLKANTAVIPFERPVPSREIGLVYRREHYKTPLIEALAESILESIPADIRKLRPKDLDVIPVD